MVSWRSAVVAVTVAFASVAKADYYIDPDSVPLSTRQSWCSDEVNTCPLICSQLSPGPPLVNECNPDTLTFGCLCGNNKQPNVSEYSLTLPYFICQEYGNQCVTACGQNNQCSSACRQDNPCGASNPKRYNTTSTSTSGAPTTTETGSNTIFSGTPGGGDDDSGSSRITPVAKMGRAYGLVIVLGSMLVAFAML